MNIIVRKYGGSSLADPEKIKLFITSAIEQVLDNDLKKILSEIIQ